MAAPACYRATAIDPTVRSVRLLRILDYDGIDQDSLARCEMRCFQLDSAPEYAALSYHWGEEYGLWGEQHLGGQHVSLNGHRLFVRYNLYQFFQRERKRKSWTRGWIWIDALCIDQENVGERNHQVGIMRDIYRQVRLLNMSEALVIAFIIILTALIRRLHRSSSGSEKLRTAAT